jgi:hypothetical protein
MTLTARALVPLGLSVALALAGCAAAGTQPAGGPPPPPPVPWREPPAYAFTLESQCGERALIGTFRVTVVDGKVSAAEGLDEPGRRALTTQPAAELVPTLRALLDRIREARQSGAHTADVEFDPVGGHPTKITIDEEESAIDDEECYTVSDFAPLSATSSPTPSG